MFKGETIISGGLRICPSCKEKAALQVMKSSGPMWYVGTMCNCGPYSRETDYFPFRVQADEAYQVVEVIFDMMETNEYVLAQDEIAVNPKHLLTDDDIKSIINTNPQARIRE